MSPSEIALQNETQRVDTQMWAALAQIRRATTCAEAVRHCHITVPQASRSLQQLMGESSFNSQAEELVKAIISRQLDEFWSSDARHQDWLQGSLQRDWNHLRGHFPNLYLFAQRAIASPERRK